MAHGWTVRGDIKDENIKKNVQLAIELCNKYFKKF